MTSPYLGWGDAKKRTTVLAAPKNSLDIRYSFHLYSLYTGNWCVGGRTKGGMLTVEGSMDPS